MSDPPIDWEDFRDKASWIDFLRQIAAVRRLHLDTFQISAHRNGSAVLIKEPELLQYISSGSPDPLSSISTDSYVRTHDYVFEHDQILYDEPYDRPKSEERLNFALDRSLFRDATFGGDSDSEYKCPLDGAVDCSEDSRSGIRWRAPSPTMYWIFRWVNGSLIYWSVSSW